MAEESHIFWSIPEHIAQLLCHLDPDSTLTLARAHEMTRSVIRGRMVWNQLLNRNSPIDSLVKINFFRDLLHLIKQPDDCLEDIFHHILESNKPGLYELTLQMTCACHQDVHSVSETAFKLLVPLETAMHRSYLILDSLAWADQIIENKTLESLASKLTIQKDAVSVGVNIGQINISDLEDASTFQKFMATIAEGSIELDCVWVKEGIGREGWDIIAEALQTHPLKLSMILINTTSSNDIGMETRDTLWAVTKTEGEIVVCKDNSSWMTGRRFKKTEETAYKRFCKCLEMTL